MTKFSGLVVSICALLAACAHQKTQPDVQFDPATDARVRVYFGVATKFFFNTTCYPKHGGKAVTKPRVFNLANTTIGMPVPADAERYYDEYVVKGGQPLTTSFSVGGRQEVGAVVLSTAYDSRAWTFVPQAGADYEIVPVQEKLRIRFLVRRLSLKDGIVSTEPEPFTSAPRCE